ncbi:MAG: 8-amino-7-oxononanoate synthase [Candidatus Nitricoxidivorans perseverans]|uniref:8-amino-7-oxononanoate synthase n=1 Tax=Candidatus Nitricoxidivorans perseverans TaxID=2975601 RepID=A0AA49FN94_9PROT|nr:MAG: 8-amino-7-oxononanoate synthase [Candidatus Nitricoxidivorans perseverans]
MPTNLERELAELADAGLLRRRRVSGSPCGPEMVIDGRSVLSFASNDYLGLANHPDAIEAVASSARRWGVGAGASHFLGGHFEPHHELEERLAAFVGAQRALIFSTGYMANLAIVPALVGRNDAVFADRLNHASLIDAVRLSDAKSHRYPHLDLEALESRLAASAAKGKLILTDAVFSMDGDVAPLPELASLAERFGAWLVVDDAHGFGVLGPQGRGTLAHSGLAPRGHVLLMGTLGKAAGVAGAFVAGDANIVEWLVQKARTAIYTTAAPPMLSAVLIESLKLIESGEERRAHLESLIARLRAGIGLLGERAGWRLPPSFTAIQPLIIGGETMRVAEALLARGIWAPAIRPPTVPEGTARLRISLSAAHSGAQVDRLVAALAEIAA